MMKHAAWRRVACLLVMWLSVNAMAESVTPASVQDPQVVRRGIIELVDYAGPTYIIDALRYGIAPDAVVQVGGSYGAPTMLRPGMRVEFLVREVSAEERVIVAIREVDRAEVTPRH